MYYLKEIEIQAPSLVELGFLFKQQISRTVITYIRAHPRTYQSEIARVLELSHSTTRRYLQQLQNHGLLEAITDGRRIRSILPSEKESFVDSLLNQVQPED